MKNIDITGHKFNNLTAIRYEKTYRNQQYWLFKCDCGKEKILPKHHVRKGEVKSCGCLLKQNKTGLKHGLSKTRLYSIFQGMKNRCYNPNEPAYKNYGLKGINICPEWLNNFKTFYNWALLNGYNDNLTIERIDNSKGYYEDNCRWIPLGEQTKNTSYNLRITYLGKTQCLAKWCEELGLNKSLTQRRLKRDGWSFERAFTTKEPLKSWVRRKKTN